MHKKGFGFLLIASAFAFSITGCSSNQAIKTTDGRTIVTDGKPHIDSDTGLVSYKDAQTGRTEQINRDKITNMSELNN
ncbi:YgdI/YgdR family lipoprotein [Yokenella regensburgei]|uniref:YgdI/YgdR family lipoprotein n=1 Tax=Yokenella regensburgei TaxID=158877 RepID=UPI003ED9F6F8